MKKRRNSCASLVLNAAEALPDAFCSRDSSSEARRESFLFHSISRDAVAMTLFILTETSAGYALLKAKDKRLLKRDDLATETETAEGISNLYVCNCAFLFEMVDNPSIAIYTTALSTLNLSSAF